MVLALTACAVKFSVEQHLWALDEHVDEHFVNDKIEKFDLIHNPFDVEITDFAGWEKKKN